MAINGRNAWLFPIELFFKILKFLSVAPLCRMRTVAPQWNNMISSSEFCIAHRHQMKVNKRYRMYINTNAVYRIITVEQCNILIKAHRIYANTPMQRDLLSSSSGLVCFMGQDRSIRLSNPKLEQTLLLPRQPIRIPYNITTAQVSYSLGHHAETDDFKLLRVTFYLDSGLEGSEAWLYSRNDNNWTTVRDFPYNRPYNLTGVYANDHLHWLTTGNDDDPAIATYSLTTGNYGLIPLNGRHFEFVRGDYGCIDTLDEETIVLYNSRCFRGTYYRIYILRDYRNLQSWQTISIFLSNIICGNEHRVTLQPLHFHNRESTRILFRLCPTGTTLGYDLTRRTLRSFPGQRIVYGNALITKYVQTFEDPRHGFV